MDAERFLTLWLYNICKTRPYILCRGVLKNTIFSYFARETATAQATVAPTMGLLPIPSPGWAP